MLPIDKWLKQSWFLYKEDFLKFSALYGLYFIVAFFLQKFLLTQPQIIMLSVLFLSSNLFQASLIIITINKIKKQEIDLKNIFYGFQFLIPITLFSVIVACFFLIGIWLFVIPALLVSAAYIFTIPLIVDKQLNFWEAMEASRQKAFANYLGVILLSALLFSLKIIGGIAFFGIGLLLTFPITINTLCYAYLELFPTEEQNKQQLVDVIIE